MVDAEKGTVEGEWRQYKDVFVGGVGGVVWQNVGGNEVPREAETKDGVRERWRRQCGRSGKHG